MGVYYYLHDETAKKVIDVDAHVKMGSMTQNEAVHYAFMNYMMENTGNIFSIISDSWDWDFEYEELDLLKYKFRREGVMEKIVEKLNAVYECERYKIVDGKAISA